MERSPTEQNWLQARAEKLHLYLRANRVQYPTDLEFAEAIGVPKGQWSSLITGKAFPHDLNNDARVFIVSAISEFDPRRPRRMRSKKVQMTHQNYEAFWRVWDGPPKNQAAAPDAPQVALEELEAIVDAPYRPNKIKRPERVRASTEPIRLASARAQTRSKRPVVSRPVTDEGSLNLLTVLAQAGQAGAAEFMANIGGVLSQLLLEAVGPPLVTGLQEQLADLQKPLEARSRLSAETAESVAMHLIKLLPPSTVQMGPEFAEQVAAAVAEKLGAQRLSVASSNRESESISLMGQVLEELATLNQISKLLVSRLNQPRIVNEPVITTELEPGGLLRGLQEVLLSIANGSPEGRLNFSRLYKPQLERLTPFIQVFAGGGPHLEENLAELKANGYYD